MPVAGTVRYSIVSGNTQGDFLIDSSTGQISVARPLDREATPSYTLGVSTVHSVGCHTLCRQLTGVGSLFFVFVFVLFLLLFYPDIHILSLMFQCAFSYVSICSILRFNMLSLTFQYALSYVSICFFLSLNMLYFTFQYAFSYV